MIRILRSVSAQFQTVQSQNDLNYLRCDVWSYIRQRCPSFYSMDCNAQFSEIFCKNVFTDMGEQELSKIISKHNQTAFCSNCQKNLNTCIEVFVNYISLEEILQLRYSFEDWPSFVINRNVSLQNLQCDECEKLWPCQSSVSSLSEVVFVEFSPGLMSLTTFTEHISMLGISYHLYAMVRNLGNHFTCAVLENNRWVYIDDLQEDCDNFTTLQQLLLRFPSGWFFGVYKKRFLEFLETSVQNNNLFSITDDKTESLTGKKRCQNIVLESDVSKLNKKRARNVVSGFKPVMSDNTKSDKNNYGSHSKLGTTNVMNSKNSDITNGVKGKRTRGQKHVYMCGFPFPLSQEEKVSSEMKAFHNAIRRKIMQCNVCFEAWPITVGSRKTEHNYLCTRCIRDKGVPKKFSAENKMIPGPVPAELQGLSQCEEMLIARAFPVMQVYLKPRYGTVCYKGHVVTLPHNVQKIADILPHCSADLPVVTFSVEGQDGKNNNFRVRRKVVLDALL